MRLRTILSKMNLGLPLLLLACGIIVGNPDNPDSEPPKSGIEVVGQLDSSTMANKNASHIFLTGHGQSALRAIGTDGSFAVPLPVAKIQALLVLDTSENGEGMVKGIFQAGNLNSLQVLDEQDRRIDIGMLQSQGRLNLNGAQAVSVDAFTSNRTQKELGSALGLSVQAVETLAANDEHLGRFYNPDLDGDGQIDSEQADFLQFQLQFTVVTQYKDPEGEIAKDYVKNKWPSVKGHNEFTHLLIRMVVSATSLPEPPDQVFLEIQKEVQARGAADDPIQSYPAGTPVPSSTLVRSDHSHHYEWALATPVSGPYVVKVKDRAYTMPYFKLPDLTENLSLVPFYQYVVDDQDLLTGIKWQWMTYSQATGEHQLASQAQLDVLLPADGGLLSVAVSGANINGNFKILRQPEGRASLADDPNLKPEQHQLFKFNDLGEAMIGYDGKLGFSYTFKLSSF